MWLALWWVGRGPGRENGSKRTEWGVGILQLETGLLGLGDER